MGRKRQRVAPGPHAPVNSTISSTAGDLIGVFAETPADSSHNLSSLQSPIPPTAFEDSSPANVVLRLFVEPSPFASPSEIASSSSPSETVLNLHSRVLSRCRYFAALFSDRWKSGDAEESSESERIHLSLGVSSTIESAIKVLKLLYTGDFPSAITTVSTALDFLPVAVILLFEDCIRSCVRFLEAVPWTEEEEARVLHLIPLLSSKESEELLARVSPRSIESCEEMLDRLIVSAIYSHPNMAFVKAFVAKLLRDFSTKESAARVLKKAFQASLKAVKESLEEYSSPDFRGDQNETEGIQRLNLQKAVTNGRHLLWLVERMIELKVADSAVEEWSEQASFTADLQKAFRDDSCRNIVPGLPAVMIRCTCKLAGAVAAGSILVTREVREKLVAAWLPVLIVCKDNVSPLSPNTKTLCLELEATFLKIILTLPMTESRELLQQCLSFSTRNVEDCPHLVTAFNTWFRRAALPVVQPDTVYK